MALFCSACGTQLPDEAAFCFKCGKSLTTPAPLSQSQVKELAKKLWTPIRNGDVGEVRRLLEKSSQIANANVEPYSGETHALEMALRYERVEIIQLLVEHGADVEYCSTGYKPPLFVAKSAAIASLLIEHGADVNRVYKGNTPLIAAIHENRIDVIRLLLERGADPNFPDDSSSLKWTPLHIAISQEKVEIVRLLLDKGADPNRRDTNGNIPLHRAAEKNLLLAVELLLKKGADVSAQNMARKVPGDYATRPDIKALLPRNKPTYRYEINKRPY